MNEQEKISQFNQDVDDVLKGNAPQAGTDPQRLDAARQLAASDFSSHSRARATTRARLLARATRELPVQNKRKEMNTRFSNLTRALAFGAMLVFLVIGLSWVLSNLETQPSSELVSTEVAPPPVSKDAGEIYMVLNEENVANPGFIRFPADCLISETPCPQPEIVPGTPQGSLLTLFEWSPNFSKLIATFRYLEPQIWMFDRIENTWTQMNIPLLSMTIWSLDGERLIGLSPPQLSPSTTLYGSLFLSHTDGSELQEIYENPKSVKIPIGWLDENQFVFVENIEKDDAVQEDLIQVFDVRGGSMTMIVDIAHPNTQLLSGTDLSPDRTQIAYSLISMGDEPRTTEVTVVQIADGSKKGISLEGTWARISWSPDGEWLASNAGLNSPCEISLLRSDGSESWKIFSGDWTGNCGFAWSPDGHYLIVPVPAQESTVPRLYLVNVIDGATRLVELPDVGIEIVLPRASWVP